MKKITIAIDGFSSCGKSTIARQLAEYSGYTYIDTGAMYRAVAYATPSGSPTEEELDKLDIRFAPQADGSRHIMLNGEDIESKIRTLEVGNRASQVAVIPEVRRFLVKKQQEMGANGGVILDGRDIGTVVFPNAELKLFLTASPEVRAQRRYDELMAKYANGTTNGQMVNGQIVNYEAVLADVLDRDYRDTHRAESPLRQAEDAIVVDNSEMSREEQMALIYRIFDDTVKRING